MNLRELTKIDADQTAVINYLVSNGFTVNGHGDRWDSGTIGIFFDDTEAVIVGYDGKPGWAPMKWRSSLSLAMPTDILLACIAAIKN
jgi:hypothetical protein